MATSGESGPQRQSFLRNPTDLLLVALTALAGLVYALLESQRDMPEAARIGRAILLILAAVLAVRAATYFLVDVLLTPSTGRKRSRLLRLAVALVLHAALGLLLLKTQFGMDPSSILLPTAVGTAILVFAMKPTLGNLVEGIALRLGEPFHIGDQVQVGAELGVIENFTWRSIDVRKRDGSLLILPNSGVSSENITVFPADAPIRCEVTFPAPITVPPHEVQVIARRIMESVPNVHRGRTIVTSVAGFHYADRDRRDRVEYSAEYFCEDHTLRPETDGTILERLWYAFARHELHGLEASDAEASVQLEALFGVEAFELLGGDARRHLVESSSRMLYAAGERVSRARLPDRIFVVVSGMIEVCHSPGRAAHDNCHVEVNAPLRNGRGAVCRLADGVLSRCTDELANHIGPFARVAVTRAARATADERRLYEMLAEEIPDPEERQSFLNGAPPAPALVLSAGDLFGDLSRFIARSPRPARIVAVSPTELLEIPVASLEAVLCGDLAKETKQRLRRCAASNLRSAVTY